MRSLLLLPALAACLLCSGQRHLLSLRTSEVGFVSDAPLERIAATNRSATGLLDIEKRDFAVRIPMRSFAGFNSPLQLEHFQENYVESRTWPNALFEGRIIEAVDLSAPGVYKVRAKGRFTVHGIARERIIPCEVTVSGEGLRVTGSFDLTLAEHDIRIPRLVEKKLAATVNVKVDLFFVPAPAK